MVPEIRDFKEPPPQRRKPGERGDTGSMVARSTSGNYALRSATIMTNGQTRATVDRCMRARETAIAQRPKLSFSSIDDISKTVSRIEKKQRAS